MLGAGGMGEVYRAIDSRLRREVALKTLSQSATGDDLRRQRFEQEARAVAALNHPNIVGIYDVGASGEVTYLISELVDGESLGSILRRGPLPLRKLLDIAVQVADGLAAAHAAKIVHRDLKPDNVMLTREGRAKILDFGLAKQTGIATAAGDQTLTSHQTIPGMILGTISYMSPEQATGRPLDHRSDQFSFGLILYEMAAGRKAFEKKESVQTLAAIVSEPPPPIDVALPQPLQWTIDRCLAKEPEGRYESTRDLYQELRTVRDHLPETTSAAVKPVARASGEARAWRWWKAGALALIAAFVSGTLVSGKRDASVGSYRFTPFGVDQKAQRDPIWSPDGKAIAFAGHNGGNPEVFVRYVDSPTAVRVTKIPEDAKPLAWSPDARRIFFLSHREPAGVWSIAVVGGEPQPVLALPPENMTVIWEAVSIAPNGRDLVAMRTGADGVVSLWISSPIGAALNPYTPAPFATPNAQNTPRVRFSPDGSKVLLYLNRGRDGEEAWLIPYVRQGQHQHE